MKVLRFSWRQKSRMLLLAGFSNRSVCRCRRSTRTRLSQHNNQSLVTQLF